MRYEGDDEIWKWSEIGLLWIRWGSHLCWSRMTDIEKVKKGSQISLSEFVHFSETRLWSHMNGCPCQSKRWATLTHGQDMDVHSGTCRPTFVTLSVEHLINDSELLIHNNLINRSTTAQTVAIQRDAKQHIRCIGSLTVLQSAKTCPRTWAGIFLLFRDFRRVSH